MGNRENAKILREQSQSSSTLETQTKEMQKRLDLLEERVSALEALNPISQESEEESEPQKGKK